MREVVWLRQSTEDLREIARFIVKDDPSAAYIALTKIKASGDSLQYNPEMGRVGRVAMTREFVVTGLPYILPYYITNKQVRILAVMHTSKKWPDGFPKLL